MCDLDKLQTHPAVELVREREFRKYDNNYYTSHYWREDLYGQSGNRGLTYDDPDHSQRFSFLFKSLIDYRKPTRLLDVGCGPGLLLANALAVGIDAWGIDWSPVAQRLFAQSTPQQWWSRFRLSSMVKLPFLEKSFDLCVCMDVLEHLPVFDVFAAVGELCRVSSADILCSINLDNPYQFHPTILSRDSWIAIFESTGLARFDGPQTEEVNSRVRTRYSEYDFFVFRHMDALDARSSLGAWNVDALATHKTHSDR